MEILIFLFNSHLKEHFSDVRHKGVPLLPESGKNTDQVTSKDMSLKKFVIQGVPFERGRTIVLSNFAGGRSHDAAGTRYQALPSSSLNSSYSLRAYPIEMMSDIKLQ